MSYCQFILDAPESDRKALHRRYHDFHYGFPIEDDNELFGRLIMEINQAGLSWETILKKEANFRAAYDDFDLVKVAAYDEDDRARLLSDAGIIRNRLKVNSAIENARRIIALQKSHGSFLLWLRAHHPLSKDQWVKLFKKHFLFTGGEIVSEFLMSIGILPGAHSLACPIYPEVLASKPLWNNEY